MIKLKKDYPYAHDGIRLVEYKEGQETNKLPDHIEAILIERGDACKCEKEKVVEPKIEKKVEEKKFDPKELPSYKEPEENKLVQPKENKEVKSPKKKKKK